MGETREPAERAGQDRGQHADASQPSNADPVINFKLERYKFILQQIHTLNENTHKHLTLFQTLATALIAGGVGIFLSSKSDKVTAEIARTGIEGLLSLLTILALFVCALIIVGIFSWVDYRKEEVDFLRDEVGLGFREYPNLKNFWRWYETYYVAFILIFIIAAHAIMRTEILPMIK
ncbi:MAG: hypothetical protein ETSY1_19050 [Candidatus Entotheonella factor]|uniref:Uncharacterized protein n=1 Tax=Entotheonella factor TaxID=1429438 RepID=W4LKZ5_ENTF1|nr:hypothetical protein [Candidatus Entotheonella palauensis]ETW98365.1 MAG: hypothetical protein ETSY1_19050 [Candidatus Entotheonella factor]